MFQSVTILVAKDKVHTARNMALVIILIRMYEKAGQTSSHLAVHLPYPIYSVTSSQRGPSMAATKLHYLGTI